MEHFVLERSLAAMTKSKYSTSSMNPFNDVDDDEDDERSKNDAFLDRIFGESSKSFVSASFFFFSSLLIFNDSKSFYSKRDRANCYFKKWITRFQRILTFMMSMNHLKLGIILLLIFLKVCFLLIEYFEKCIFFCCNR